MNSGVKSVFAKQVKHYLGLTVGLQSEQG